MSSLRVEPALDVSLRLLSVSKIEFVLILVAESIGKVLSSSKLLWEVYCPEYGRLKKQF